MFVLICKTGDDSRLMSLPCPTCHLSTATRLEAIAIGLEVVCHPGCATRFWSPRVSPDLADDLIHDGGFHEMLFDMHNREAKTKP